MSKLFIGYARVSTHDQNLDLQREALQQAGCKRIYEDHASGSHADRPGLQQALDQLREDDTFVVWKLDRLGRNVANLISFVANLEKSNIHLIVERTRAGLLIARQRGRIGGRKRRMTPSKIEAAKQLLTSGVPPKEVAHNLGVSIPTLYRWIPAGKTTITAKQ